MKIAILGDTHFGARNSNKVIEHWQRRFYEETFWPYIEQHGIQTVIQTGDYFDNRKWINLQTMAFQRNVFVKRAQNLGVNVVGIVGNHDIPNRHDLENSSVSQILNPEENFNFFDTIQTIEYADRKITFMPWICKANAEECMEVIEEGGDIIVGHYEIANFEMHPGAKSLAGINAKSFGNWNKVISGHYHSQSIQGNIQYVGTPYQMSWNDATTKHGFWILDTDDTSMTFIENPNRYFNRFYWNDGCKKPVENLYNSFVKVNVQKKTNFELFEKFIDKVNFESPFDLKITESFEEFNAENVNDLIATQSTEDLISEYIEEVGTDNNKDAVKKLMLMIYQEAMSIEE